ncbi:MAG: hypothetical protein EOO65_03400 [Methanosarcinales archaeon]|nr:MAG: hypothetical protein EOO65_03400 [Methanosarcinales archaeon]
MDTYASDVCKSASEVAAARLAAAAAGSSRSPHASMSGVTSASGAGCQSLQRETLLPHLSRKPVGMVRCFELPLRDDVSNDSVLNAVIESARAVGLERSTASPTAVLLQQRFSVPAAAWSHFLTSISVAGLADTGRCPIELRAPQVATEASAAAGSGMVAGSVALASRLLGNALGSKSVTYANNVTAAIGCSASGTERVLLLCVSRHVEEGALPPTMKVLAKASVSGAATAAGSLNARPISTSLQTTTRDSGVSELWQTQFGVLCVVAQKLPSPSFAWPLASGSKPGFLARLAASHQQPTSNVPGDLFGTAQDGVIPWNMGTEDSASETDVGADIVSENRIVSACLSLQQELRHVPSLPHALSRVRSAVCDETNKAGRLLSDVESALAPSMFDDGGVVAQPGAATTVLNALQQWAPLRVSFLDAVALVPGAAGGSTTPAGLAGESFPLSHLADELVLQACALSAQLRGHAILAESAWRTALESVQAGASVHDARGEGPSLASKTMLLHADTFSVLQRGAMHHMEVQLFQAVSPWDTKAALHESLAVQLARTLGAAHAAVHQAPPPLPSLPPLSALPLDPETGREQSTISYE